MTRASMPSEHSVRLRALDGLHLAATLVTSDKSPDGAVVLVHGGGVTREEGGFFVLVRGRPGRHRYGILALRPPRARGTRAARRI
jgi:hypothetical protein